MKKSNLLILLSLTGLVACNSPERDSNKSAQTENNVSNQPEEDVLEPKAIGNEHDSTVSKQAAKPISQVKKSKKEVVDIIDDENLFIVEPEQYKNYMVPVMNRNTCRKEGENYYFKRMAFNDIDTRVGSTGSGNELSFTIIETGSSFLIENEKLKNINFKYQTNGELYQDNGVDPYKGKIKGTLLSNNVWLIEINVSIMVMDIQLNKERDKSINVTDKFVF